MKPVAEVYSITPEDIDNLKEMTTDGNPYWEKCLGFVTEWLHQPASKLSEAQKAWLEDILEEIQR